jgi:hypothetical protein
MNRSSNVERPGNVERPPKYPSVNFIRELSDKRKLKQKVNSFVAEKYRTIAHETNHRAIHLPLRSSGLFIKETAAWYKGYKDEWNDEFMQPAKLTGLDPKKQTDREEIKARYKDLTAYEIAVNKRRETLATMVGETKLKLRQEFAGYIESKAITNGQRSLDKKMKQSDEGLVNLISKIDSAREMHTDLYTQGDHDLLAEIQQEPAPVYAPHPIEGEQLPAYTYTPLIEGEQHTPPILDEQHTPPILDEQLPAYTEGGFLS